MDISTATGRARAIRNRELMSRVQGAENDKEEQEDRYLRENGWEYSSQYPGSYWMWSKQMPSETPNGKVKWKGGVYVCNRVTAMKMQNALDMWTLPDPDEPIGDVCDSNDD